MKMKMINWKRFALENYGYEVFTTFGNDFDIADSFGLDAIQDTFNRAFNEWKSDYRYLTELVLILNWKACQYADKKEYCELYSDLYHQADTWALDNLTGEEKSYYFKVTD